MVRDPSIVSPSLRTGVFILEVLEVDILWPRWVARIGVTRATEPELVPPRHAAGVAARLTARSGERVAVTVRGVL